MLVGEGELVLRSLDPPNQCRALHSGRVLLAEGLALEQPIKKQKTITQSVPARKAQGQFKTLTYVSRWRTPLKWSHFTAGTIEPSGTEMVPAEHVEECPGADLKIKLMFLTSWPCGILLVWAK